MTDNVAGPQRRSLINQEPFIIDILITDLRARHEFGKIKYGTFLQPFNGRDSLLDAYQESLDLAGYLCQELYQRDHGCKDDRSSCGDYEI